jgi:MFS family permease
MPPSKRSPLTFIFLTIFIDLLGIGILFPVIPQLLANPESPEYLLPASMTLAQGFVILGLLSASYPIAQFVAAPILGQLSDIRGRRPILESGTLA